MSIAGLILSGTVGVDTLPPDRQTDLDHAEMVSKDLAVFKNAGEVLQNTWSKLEVRGNPVQARYTLPKVRFHSPLRAYLRKRLEFVIMQ